MGPVGTGDWGLGLGLDNIFYSRALTKYEFDNKRIKELKCVFRIVRLVRGIFFLSSGFGDHSGEVSQEPL